MGDVIAFTLSDVNDSGGTRRRNCDIESIPAVNPQYTWQLSVPPGYPQPLPPLAGSGASATVLAAVPGSYSCTFTATAERDCPPSPRTVGPASVTVAGLVSLEWDEFASYSTPLDGCPNNGDQRIFPDRRYVIDTYANDRDNVALLATIDPPIEGCTVYFRTWDVDDPFDQNNPTMPNVTLIDADASGPDNRLPGGGGDSGVGTWSATTDASGQARETVTVSMQPGNNYRAGASLIQTAIAGASQADVDANNPPQHVVFTTMLTVWRKVWLELDSMAAGSDISHTGVIDEITNNSPHAGDGTVELDVPDINDDGRFAGGTMTVPATGGSYTIIDNVDVSVDDDYTMSLLIAPGDFAQTATVVDDDTAVLPKTPDANQTVLNEKYRNCYIEFTENAATRDNTNLFVATLPGNVAVAQAKGLENADLTPADGFWTTVIVTCYQPYGLSDDTGAPRSTRDGDPDLRYHIHGTSWVTGDGAVTYAWAITGGANVVLFFLETSMDRLLQDAAGYTGIPARPLTFLEPQTIAHEIGHGFGLPDVGPGTLMGPYDGSDPDFDAEEVNQIRDSDDLSS